MLSCECLCPSCRGSTMFITGRGNDSWMWRCRRKSCERRISLRVGTIFKEVPSPFRRLCSFYVVLKIFRSLEWLKKWTCPKSHSSIGSFDTRRYAPRASLRHPSLGGPGQTVEIDECKSGTGKYRVTIMGVMRDSVSVFGGINRSKKTRYSSCRSRTVKSLH